MIDKEGPVLPEKRSLDLIKCQDCCTCNSAKAHVLNYCKSSKSCIFLSFELLDICRNIAIFDFILAFGVTAAELVFTALPNSYVRLYNEYNMKGEIVTEQYNHQTSLFLTVVIICMFLLIFEGWLFDILLKGAIERDRKKLNRWLNIRMIFLAINMVMTIYRILELEFCLYDIIYTPVVMYRVLEIVLVKGLITELRDISADIGV